MTRPPRSSALLRKAPLPQPIDTSVLVAPRSDPALCCLDKALCPPEFVPQGFPPLETNPLPFSEPIASARVEAIPLFNLQSEIPA